MKCQSFKGKCRFSSSTGGILPASAAMNARRALLRRIQRQELQKLRQLLPSSICRPSTSIVAKRTAAADSSRYEQEEAAVILDTIRYIDALHSTIFARVRAGSLPSEVLDQLHLMPIGGGGASVSTGTRRCPPHHNTTTTTAPRRRPTDEKGSR